jgi:ATP-dependent DNA helicase RecQ
MLLAGQEDENIHDYFRRTAFPSEEEVETILRALEDTDGLSIRELEQRANLRYGQIDKALKYLSVEERAPVIKEGSRWKRTPVPYQLNHAQIERLTRQREIEWEEVQNYIATDGCLMQFLRHALDDPATEPCGKCARCVGKEIVPSTFDRHLGLAATGFLRRSEIPLEAKKQIPRGSLDAYGLATKFPAELLPNEGRVLSRWGDAGWGSIVAEGKHANTFSDELVAAVVDMIRNRWRPQPPPRWVTCVPSRNHPELVPDFATRVAAALGLPFRAVVTKTRDNEPQKAQQNTFHRCKNLDGVFTIDEPIPRDPVLLIDDVVDSGWTLAIISALLLRAGSGSVFPLALASTSTSD